LWEDVKRLNKVTDHHGNEIEDLKSRVGALEREVKGARVSRGIHKARSARAVNALAEAEIKLSEIKARLN
ncbi:MAG TPA: hypothetical protein VMB84_10255, partial [Stellaceae bacterium]|nr:hypothetical protein [Stellaceae bacterium]